jgi:phage tail-like protein
MARNCALCAEAKLSRPFNRRSGEVPSHLPPRTRLTGAAQPRIVDLGPPAGRDHGFTERVPAMAQFTVNPHRLDPYKNFKFRIRWDGQVVAGVSKISALRRTTEVVEHREGADPSTSHKSPGRTTFEPITLERGVTHDEAFERWANKVWDFDAGAGAEVSLKDFRKDITLELHNEAGQVVIAYRIFRCWPSSFTALPDLDADGAAVAFQTLVLQNEGWVRDTSVKEPEEPSFDDPS